MWKPRLWKEQLSIFQDEFKEDILIPTQRFPMLWNDGLDWDSYCLHVRWIAARPLLLRASSFLPVQTFAWSDMVFENPTLKTQMAKEMILRHILPTIPWRQCIRSTTAVKWGMFQPCSVVMMTWILLDSTPTLDMALFTEQNKDGFEYWVPDHGITTTVKRVCTKFYELYCDLVIARRRIHGSWVFLLN